MPSINLGNIDNFFLRKKFREHQDLNPGLLGAKQKHFPLCYPAHPAANKSYSMFWWFLSPVSPCRKKILFIFAIKRTLWAALATPYPIQPPIPGKLKSSKFPSNVFSSVKMKFEKDKWKMQQPWNEKCFYAKTKLFFLSPNVYFCNWGILAIFYRNAKKPFAVNERN